jgi:hypothetical protein
LDIGIWDSYSTKSENLSLTFLKSLIETPLPTVGGDEGEGEPNGLYFGHPALALPHRRGRRFTGKFQIFLFRVF